LHNLADSVWVDLIERTALVRAISDVGYSADELLTILKNPAMSDKLKNRLITDVKKRTELFSTYTKGFSNVYADSLRTNPWVSRFFILN
jgi:hypothetical protein